MGDTMMKQSDIQKARQQMQAEIELMQAEIEQLEAKIKKAKSQKKFKSVRSLSFITPFIKALVLTAVILFVYAQFGVN